MVSFNPNPTVPFKGQTPRFRRKNVSTEPTRLYRIPKQHEINFSSRIELFSTEKSEGGGKQYL